ncbi:STAS domain-containing protein [Desertibacillus haloalkaliphilus]|uniref:STAS domain-containing protein n=1 Tax=Desertibacillus haloalkaliphilus TaxID=1328930 RepID=UPI001C255009|nr:STAS domain-containing protein [Desertibacillus haloalkaliphilus]MBU8908763.1 STAS domain-containing protein [Desertibacillus haloalkaliphilus]
MQPFIVEFIHSRKDELVERWLEELTAVRDKNLENMSDAVYQHTNREFIQTILHTLDADVEQTGERLSEFTSRLIKLGWPLGYFTQGLQTFRRMVFEALAAEEDDAKKVYRLSCDVEEWIDSIINQFVNDYNGSWESTINLQKMALRELSAPLIPVFENISVMPLIGTIDTERARLIMENLLEGVIEHRSQVVLIDITGVPVVDTMVANHIIQASEAVRLVGTECILVGIRPEIAQTIVNLGIELGKFPTKSSLQKGIETALEMTNKKMVDI